MDNDKKIKDTEKDKLKKRNRQQEAVLNVKLNNNLMSLSDFLEDEEDDDITDDYTERTDI